MLDRTQAPPLKKFEYQGFPTYYTQKLSNGIELILIPFGDMPVLEIQMVVQTGYCYEPQNAVAQSAFKLLTDGTPKYSSSEFAEKLDFYGSEISCSVGYEQSSITLSTLTKHVENTLPLLFEVYTQANFPENEWFTYQQRMIKNLEIEGRKTQAMASKFFLKRLWGNYPYGKKVTKEDFQVLDLEIIRKYHQTEILKNQIYLIVSGNFEETTILKLLNEYFGKLVLNSNQTPSLSKILSPKSEIGIYIHNMDNQVQSSIKLGHISIPKNHPDYEELQVLGTLLGGFFGSRLMKNIREEKGFTYGIYGGFLGMKENGYFVVSTDVANEYVDATLEEIYKEIQRIQNEKVTEEELQVVKNYMLGNLLSSMETPFQIADMLSLLKLNNLTVEHLKKTFQLIKNIKTERITELANQYINLNNMIVVIAGTRNY
jgi:predicted Zn-dependent peptidase